MAWGVKKVEEQRKELLKAYAEKRASMTELCKQFEVSRKTGYKWIKRALERGSEEGLKDLSRAPHNPNRLFSNEQIDLAISLKQQHRTWGPKKILAKLAKDYPNESWPSSTRLHEIFKGYELVNSRKRRKGVCATHPLGELNNSNDVWIADFKGWFLTEDNRKCEPLTITDGFSRFLIRCTHLEKKSVSYVWPLFAEAFREFGLPLRIRTDNGPPFGSVGIGRLTQLSINFIKAGVLPEWIRPGHPEDNGRHERFHLTLKEAVATPPAKDLKEQIQRMRVFQEEYNFERPHEALKMNVPRDYYCLSPRSWDGLLRPPEYDTHLMIVRKVGQSGCIWVKQREYYLGQTLTGEYVGLKEENLSELSVYYGPVYLGKLTLNQKFERPQGPMRRRKNNGFKKPQKPT